MRAIRQCDHRWVIVLAGGSGARPSVVTRDGGAPAVPPQYRPLRSGSSLLRDAVNRAASLAAEEQVLAVVAREHEEHWRREFRGNELERLVVQPRDRGTAAGVLLPLFAVLNRDPDAVVTLLPCDQTAEEWTLVDALRAAQRAVAAAPGRPILLGVEPDSVGTCGDWILHARRAGRHAAAHAAAETLSITALVEQPDRASAAALWTRGAVWNSFQVVATGAALLALYARTMPALLRAFEHAHPASPGDWCALYERIETGSFSRTVLAGSVRQLGLGIVPPCGFTDLGATGRVAPCLASPPSSPVVAGRAGATFGCGRRQR